MDIESRIQAVLDAEDSVAHVLFFRDRHYQMKLDDRETLEQIEDEAEAAWAEFKRLLMEKLGPPTRMHDEPLDFSSWQMHDIEWASCYLLWTLRPDRHHVLYRAMPDEPEMPLFLVFGMLQALPPAHEGDLDPWKWRWEGNPMDGNADG